MENLPNVVTDARTFLKASGSSWITYAERRRERKKEKEEKKA